MRWPLLAAILAALPLAGCASNVDEGFAGEFVGSAVDASQLASSSYYVFRHDGGGLEFSLMGNGSASLELFDGDDIRLGEVNFGTEGGQQASYGLVGVHAGDLVLHVLSLDGILHVQSRDEAVTQFQPLGQSVERVALVSRPHTSTPIYLPVMAGDSVDEVVPVPLGRAPSELRILASGQYTDLAVTVTSQRGPALSVPARTTSPVGPQSFVGSTFVDLGGTLHPENFWGGNFQARIAASDLSGALVLEAVSYSRSQIHAPEQALAVVEKAAFTYGLLPDDAVSFLVHPDAQYLYLWQDLVLGESPGNGTAPETPGDRDAAWVAIYDPLDVKLGTVRVPFNVTVQIPVASGGEYVAVALFGATNLGSDKAPGDFQLHPLAEAETVVPTAAAGSNGVYAVANETVTATGIPIRVAITTAGTNGDIGVAFLTPCAAGGQVRLDSDGEAILLAGELQGPDLQGSLRLGAGRLSVTWDGFGDDTCQHPAIAIAGYLRQAP